MFTRNLWLFSLTYDVSWSVYFIPGRGGRQRDIVFVWYSLCIVRPLLHYFVYLFVWIYFFFESTACAHSWSVLYYRFTHSAFSFNNQINHGVVCFFDKQKIELEKRVWLWSACIAGWSRLIFFAEMLRPFFTEKGSFLCRFTCIAYHGNLFLIICCSLNLSTFQDLSFDWIFQSLLLSRRSLLNFWKPLKEDLYRYLLRPQETPCQDISGSFVKMEQMILFHYGEGLKINYSLIIWRTYDNHFSLPVYQENFRVLS